MAVKRIPCPFKKGDIVFAYAESRPTLKALVLEAIDGIEGDDRREPPRIRYRVLEVYCSCGLHPKEGEERIGDVTGRFWRKGDDER